MSEPKFDKRRRIKLYDYSGKLYYLYRSTWKRKIAYFERGYLGLNFDKVELKLKHPDEVRKSTKNVDSRIFYRRFDRITLKKGITVPWSSYFAVIVNEKSGRIQTIYPTKKKKRGEKLWPK